jgi:hypothetical protein
MMIPEPEPVPLNGQQAYRTDTRTFHVGYGGRWRTALTPQTLAGVQAAAVSTHDRLGGGSPLNTTMPLGEKFVALTNAYVAVGRALAEDLGDHEGVRRALTQLAAVAALWRQSLDTTESTITVARGCECHRPGCTVEHER